METIVRIQVSIRKAFTEIAAVLLEWEEAQCTSMKILASLVNASQRRKDYTESVGKLGVLSNFDSAEHLVQVGTLANTFTYGSVFDLGYLFVILCTGPASPIPG
jgi:hypothetical protein